MIRIYILIIAFILASCASSPTPKHNYLASGESCTEILNSGKSSKDGIYLIDPDGAGGINPFKTYCDMTHEGGGWMLYAYHADGVQTLEKKELVNKSSFGVLGNKKWKALRNNMKVGMMFIDENGRVSTISAAKLNSGNCTSTSSVHDLSVAVQTGKGGSGGLWHNEDSGCLITGGDYSVVQIRGKSYKNYKIAGSALYQQSAQKFDKWPYARDWSHEDQNTLLYFIK